MQTALGNGLQNFDAKELLMILVAPLFDFRLRL